MPSVRFERSAATSARRIPESTYSQVLQTAFEVGRLAKGTRASLLRELHVPVVVCLDQHGTFGRDRDVPADRGDVMEHAMRTQRTIDHLLPLGKSDKTIPPGRGGLIYEVTCLRKDANARTATAADFFTVRVRAPNAPSARLSARNERDDCSEAFDAKVVTE